METNKIYNEECLEGMEKRIPDNSIDMVLADLPYGTTACDWDSIIPLEPLWEQYKRIGKDDTPYVFTASQPFATKLINSNADWFKYEWIWQKNTTSGFALAEKRPMRNHENILVFYKNQPCYNPIKEDRDLSESSKERMNYDFNSTEGENKLQGGINKVVSSHNDNDKSFPKTVQKINNIVNSDPDRKHPTQKPVPLFEYLIKTYTNRGDVVLDNVMGSGTTGVACLKTDRKFIGFEQDEDYYHTAIKRVGEFDNKYYEELPEDKKPEQQQLI